MADHYYSSRPVSAHDIQRVEVELRGVRLELNTDAGVFSKRRIDPGTELLIDSLQIHSGLRDIFDLGCGYGPIGMVLAKLLPEATIYMSDINERAVELAKQNAATNGIGNVIIKAGEGFTPFPGQNFDLVVTNPPVRAGKQVIYALIDEAWHALRPGGYVAAVILTRQGAKSLEQKMADVFGNVAEWEKGGGYRVVASLKK
jgi:16S rRNA (guanine1207-N2)-methyltransferase